MILFVIFVAAVPLFGWIDLVGHSAICVALALLTLVKPRRCLVLPRMWCNGVLQATLFAFTVTVLMALYFGLHAVYIPGWSLSPSANRMVVSSGS